jgi:hypothetical protein
MMIHIGGPMLDNFFHNASPWWIGLVMVLAMFLMRECGYRISRRKAWQPAAAEKQEKTVGTITGAMLALLGFMLAVSISMADGHFESRRRLVLDEANAIGTSHLRAQAVGGPQGEKITHLLKDYAQLRLDFFAAGEDRKRLESVYEKTAALQQQLWGQASAIARTAPTPISAVLLTSLNEVFDLATSRRWALEVRVPASIIKLLFAFSLLSMGLLGYYFGICGPRHPILSLVLIAAFTAAILIIVDLNRPRSGFIQPEQSPVIWILDEMKSPEVPVKKTLEFK